MTYQDSSRERPIWPFVVAGVIVAVAALGYFVVRDVIAFGRPLPEFPSLVTEPDPSLHGTVAFFSVEADPKTQPTGGCIRVVAAAGAPIRDVLCFEGGAADTGPQLVFLPDGRLEVTMFSWPADAPLTTAWQKVVDVTTGEMVETPTGSLPTGVASSGSTTTPTGDEIVASTGGNRAELALVASDGTSRTLWSADVSPEYSIRAIWAPNWDWVLAYDGRLLVATVDEPSQIRVLVEVAEGLGGFGSTEPLIPIYAVTDADLVQSG